MSEAVAWLNLESALRDGEPTPDARFLEALVADALLHEVQESPGWKIYRARIMPLSRELDVEPLLGPEMRPPSELLATAGRANAKGVPYFYGALEPDTAVAEMRPWRGARVSVAQFISTQPLKLVDLSGTASHVPQGRLTSWAGFMMGRPVHREDEAGYLATQLMATRMRAIGVEGLLYSSAMRPEGVNAVLFSDAKLECKYRDLYDVLDVSHKTTLLWDGQKPDGGWTPIDSRST